MPSSANFKLSKLATCLLVLSSQAAWSQETTENKKSEDELEIIVVTADRREESSIHVPGSLQVFNQNTIDVRQYLTTDELMRAVPNANLTNQRAGLGESSFSMRGIGTTTVNVDQTIGFYVDDIPMVSVTEFDGDFLDVAQIEVLKGPQGTLYGRNAIGGLVHIKTNDPIAEHTMKTEVGVGSDNTRLFNGTVNAPLGSDKLLSRLSFSHQSRDGRIKNLIPGVEDVDRKRLNTGRLKLAYLPNDDLSVTLSADISHMEKNTATGTFDEKDKFAVSNIRPAVIEKDNHGISVKVDYQWDDYSLVSITSHRNHQQKGSGGRPETANYSAAVPQTIPFNNNFTGEVKQNSLTQEVRIESPFNPHFHWIAGLFYQNNDVDRIGDVVNVSTRVFERSFADTKGSTFAAFADMTYGLDAHWFLTTGIRASRDKKEMDYRHVGSFLPVIGFQFAPNQTLALDKSFNDISPRLVLEYRPNDNTNWYIKGAKGYKAGGFNTEFLGPVNVPYGKETLWNYEAGVKALLLDNRLEVAASVFHMDWKDQQVLVFANGISQVSNANKSKSQGAELELRAKVAPGLELTSSVGYVKATFEKTPTSLPVEGKRQPNAPGFSGSLGAYYEFEVGQAEVYVSGDWSFQNSFYWDVANSLEEPRHSFLNMSSGVRFGEYQVSIYGKNLTDEDYRTFVVPGTPGFFAAQAQPGTGREVGIKFSAEL